MRLEFTPATGDPDGYEYEWRTQRTSPETEFLLVRVRGYKDATLTEELEIGPWSDYSEPIYIPEAPQWLALPACILLLLGMRWLARALGRLP